MYLEIRVRGLKYLASQRFKRKYTGRLLGASVSPLLENFASLSVPIMPTFICEILNLPFSSGTRTFFNTFFQDSSLSLSTEKTYLVHRADAPPRSLLSCYFKTIASPRPLEPPFNPWYNINKKEKNTKFFPSKISWDATEKTTTRIDISR